MPVARTARVVLDALDTRLEDVQAELANARHSRVTAERTVQSYRKIDGDVLTIGGTGRPAARNTNLACGLFIAIRVARACHEAGVESVAVYSDPDANAPHVKAADRAVRIGPAAPGTAKQIPPLIRRVEG